MGNLRTASKSWECSRLELHFESGQHVRIPEECRLQSQKIDLNEASWNSDMLPILQAAEDMNMISEKIPIARMAAFVEHFNNLGLTESKITADTLIINSPAAAISSFECLSLMMEFQNYFADTGYRNVLEHSEIIDNFQCLNDFVG